MILSEVALLLVMPEDDAFNTAEVIMIAHIIYMFLALIVIGMPFLGESELVGSDALGAIIAANVTVTALTVAFTLREYGAYNHMVKGIKSRFKSEGIVGSFEHV